MEWDSSPGTGQLPYESDDDNMDMGLVGLLGPTPNTVMQQDASSDEEFVIDATDNATSSVDRRMDNRETPALLSPPMMHINSTASSSYITHDPLANGRLFEETVPVNTDGTTGLFYDPRLLLHTNLFETGSSGYCEVPARIEKAYGELRERGLVERCQKVTARAALIDDLRLVHTGEHVDEVIRTADMDVEALQQISTNRFNDVYFSQNTSEAARLSCGGAIAIAEAVWEERVRNAVALIRPPGHHAESTKAMGFCIYNNVSVAARVMQKRHGVKRIMIVDWDIHHGNGTQKVFYNDPDILYVSLHRYDNGYFFPALVIADADYVGGKDAKGRNINIPWPCAGINDADYIHAFNRVVMPTAYEFNPELVLVSAGFDAAAGDPLGGCRVTPAGYAHMTHMLMSLAGGKVAVCLEGGYNLKSVSTSVGAVTSVLLGDAPPAIDISLGPTPAAVEAVQKVVEIQSRWWKSLQPVYIESPPTPQTLHHLITPFHTILSNHRAYVLQLQYKLRPLQITDEELDDKFAGHIHVSDGLEEHKGFLIIFVHGGWVDVRGKLASESNLVKMTDTYLNDATTRYIDSVLKHGHALIDVDVHSQEMNKHEAGFVAKEVVKCVWDSVGRKSKAKRVLLIGADIGARALTGVLSARVNLRKRTEAAVMMYSSGTPAAIHPSCDEWWFEVSRCYVWSSEIPRGRSCSTSKKLGCLYSCGPEPSHVTPTTLMNSVYSRCWRFLARRLTEAYLDQINEKSGAVNGRAGNKGKGRVNVGRVNVGVKSPKGDKVVVELEGRKTVGRNGSESVRSRSVSTLTDRRSPAGSEHARQEFWDTVSPRRRGVRRSSIVDKLGIIGGSLEEEDIAPEQQHRTPALPNGGDMADWETQLVGSSGSEDERSEVDRPMPRGTPEPLYVPSQPAPTPELRLEAAERIRSIARSEIPPYTNELSEPTYVASQPAPIPDCRLGNSVSAIRETSRDTIAAFGDRTSLAPTVLDTDVKSDGSVEFVLSNVELVSSSAPPLNSNTNWIQVYNVESEGEGEVEVPVPIPPPKRRKVGRRKQRVQGETRRGDGASGDVSEDEVRWVE